MKQLLLAWVILVHLRPCSAQDYSIQEQVFLDSLSVVVNSEIHDSIKVGALSEMSSFYYRKGNVEKTFDRLNQLLKIVEDIGYESETASCLHKLGAAYYSQGQTETALSYYEKSLRIRMKIGDKLGVASSFNNLGSLYRSLGDVEIAISYFKKSLKMRREMGSKSGIAQGLNNLGTVYHGRGQVDTAFVYFEESLKVYEEINDRSRIANSLSNLGAVYYGQGQFEIAISYLEKSLNIQEEIGEKSGIASSLSILGTIHNKQGKISESLSYFERSLKINKETGRKSGVATCLNNLGAVYYGQGQIEVALSYYQQSLKTSEEIRDKSGIASCINNLGSLYKSLGQIETAINYFERGLKMYDEMSEKYGLASMLHNLGGAYQYQDQFATAVSYYKKSLNIRLEIGDKSGIANSLNNLGAVYNDLGEIETAISYYMKSLRIREEIEDKFGIASNLINLGYGYDIQGNYETAFKYCYRGLELSKELGSPNLLKNAYELMFILNKKKGNYKGALSMYELHIQMRDSINNESTQKAAIKQNMQYEYEKQHLADSLETSKELALKDIEITKQQAEAKAERTTKYGLYGGLALVLVIAFVLARSVKQKKKANEEITHQKQEVEHKNKEILDSITYAERIQSAILPPMSLMNEKLGDGFVLYKPKDIVAGDFYWLETIGDDIYFSAADCTGHGVPGAMMSVMCSNALTKCVKELGLTKPGEILDATTKIIEGRFERSEQLVLDGMDLALCKLNLQTMKLEYAGANNPLWIIRAGEVLETKADKQPIGQYDHRLPYTNHQIQLQKGDSVYIFSDGYADQFGGPKGKKFKSKPFKQLLLAIQNETIEKQKELIDEAFETWRGKNEQVDDVCVIGVRI